MIKYYKLLKVKTVERGTGYSKGLEIEEKVVKKSIHIEKLIKELEKAYPENTSWILIPKHLIKDNPFEYEKIDYCIVKTDLIEEEEIEGIEYNLKE